MVLSEAGVNSSFPDGRWTFSKLLLTSFLLQQIPKKIAFDSTDANFDTQGSAVVGLTRTMVKITHMGA